MEKENAQRHYRKMTETNTTKLIMGLAIPSIAIMLITNIYNLADTAFVGRLGTSASGAVGVVFGFMAIIQAIGFMVGQGAGSIMSRLLGGKDEERAYIFASTGFACSFILGAIVAVICFFCIDDLVFWLGSTPTIAPYAKAYISYILIAAPFMSSSLTLNNLLRYEGKSVLGMVGMMTGGILNMIGDPILMFGFGMGIHGAGLSTAISQIISFGLLLGMFLTHRSTIILSFKNVRFDFSMILDIMSTGCPSLLRQALNSITTVVLNMQAAAYGDQAVAAMSIVSRVIFFSLSVCIGIGQGFQPVCAFNYGAKKFSRVRDAFKSSLMLGQIVLFVIAALLLIFSGSVIGIFRDDPEVIVIGTRALRLQAWVLAALPFEIITEMMLQSSGKRLAASILSSMRGGILFIPALLILANLRGLSGIQEAQPLAFLIALPIYAVFYRNFSRHLTESQNALDGFGV